MHTIKLKNHNIQRITIGKWEADISYCKNTNLYTICYAKKGGAMICNQNKDEAIAQWLHAMNVAESVQKLINFNSTGILAV